MKAISIKAVIFLLFICTLFKCIDPFIPDIKNSDSILIVDALLTNEECSYSVKLYRSSGRQNSDPSLVSGALVSIRDENGNTSLLWEITEGLYKTDSLLFQGEIGNSYILYIKTSDGNEYESDACKMNPVQQIVNLSYYKDQELVNNEIGLQSGIRIFIETEKNSQNKYLRWVYNEWWKIIVPEPKKYNYLNDTTINEVAQIKQVCWGNHRSDEILIQSIDFLNTDKEERIPIMFLASALTNRFLIQYSIEVTQLSVSPNEFAFWEQMRMISENGGDIFEQQPFPVVSNIHNIHDTDEPVLGYFQVSAVSKKRIYILSKDLIQMGIPLFNYDCDKLTLGPDDFPPDDLGGRISFNDIHTIYAGPTYAFVEPVYDQFGNLYKLGFAKHACTDCTLNGTLTKPAFWIDLE